MGSKVVNAIKAVKIDKCFSLLCKLQRLSGCCGAGENFGEPFDAYAMLLSSVQMSDWWWRTGRQTNVGCSGRMGVEGRWTITNFQQGQCKFGVVGRRISLQTPLLPELFGLRLYFWRSCFFVVIVFKTSLHASSTGLQQCNIELSVGYRKGVWIANF